MVESSTNINPSGEITDQHGVADAIPFDPNDITISTLNFSTYQIILYLEHKDITMDREFKRSSDSWDMTKKSRFIESILLKLPVPAFYFVWGDNDSWEIIDGLQRIKTIKSFVIDKTLELENLEFLKEYNKCKFEDLPLILQRRIKIFPITVNLLGKGTPDAVKYNIFKRING